MRSKASARAAERRRPVGACAASAGRYQVPSELAGGEGSLEEEPMLVKVRGNLGSFVRGPLDETPGAIEHVRR